MSKKMNEALKVLANHGRVLREAAEDPLTFATHPSEIDSPEDTWASGESIALELDHAHVTHDAEEQVTEPETMKISELRKIIAAGLKLRETLTPAYGYDDEWAGEENLADDYDYADGLEDAESGFPIRKDASPAYLEGYADGGGQL